MDEISKLSEERLRIRANQEFDVSEEDYERIKPKLNLLNQLSRIERSLYAVYDNYRHEFILQSKDQKNIFDNLDIPKSQMESHYHLIHPEDLAFVLETDNLTPYMFSKFDRDEQLNLKLIYDFRIKNVFGTYSRYMHQIMILEHDKNKNPWLVLVISDLLATGSNKIKPDRKMINIVTGETYYFKKEEGVNAYTLTAREKEILKLLSIGYDSINIADKLNISINTVNNHRQNILRKTKADNSTQAVMYSKRLGLI